MNSNVNRGAHLQALASQPSVDLAQLIEVLIAAINPNRPDPDSHNPLERPFIHFNTERKRLKVCTSGVLRRLFKLEEFKNAFGAESKGAPGFIRDFQTPKYGLSAILGGRLTEDNPGRLPTLLERLIREIDRNSPDDETLSLLLLHNTEAQLQTLAKKIEGKLFSGIQTASMQSIVFEPQERPLEGGKPVAKVISALEQIETKDYFEKMKIAICKHLENQEQDEDTIEEALKNLEVEKDRLNSQIARFLHFIENEALARVRLNICLGIMEEIANGAGSGSDPNSRLLVNYVNNILGAIELSKQEPLTINLARHYGLLATFTLDEYLDQAYFYSCLAVWPEAKTQIFEERTIVPAAGEAIQREVSYRFRINGNNPETGKSAFLSKLKKIEEKLLSENREGENSSSTLNRCLAELIFLDAVIPKTRNDEAFDPQKVLTSFRERQNFLEQRGREGIKELIGDLEKRESNVSKIATSLINILREKSDRLLKAVRKRTERKYIGVRRNIINWQRLETGHNTELLIGSGRAGNEQTEWFKQIEIIDRPKESHLFSVEVTTKLSGHKLVCKNEPPLTLQGQRILTPLLLQVLWVPWEWEKDEGTQQRRYRQVPTTEKALSFALDAAIVIEYETSVVKSREGKVPPDANQYHAAAVTAFALLTYICLWRIIGRLQNLQGKKAEPFTTLVLRLQTQGKKEAEKDNGNDYIYAAAQSIELLLNQDISLRMQGINLENIGRQGENYVKQGSFQALLSAFPLRLSVSAPPKIPKLGIISYSIRPCDEYPDRERSANCHLLVSKSYSATAVSQPFPSYEIKVEKTGSDVIYSSPNVDQQRMIKEHIWELRDRGIQHIILLSNSYGGRKLNRTSVGNNYLLHTHFLEDIFQAYPNITLYPLVKDVFPATRLYTRQKHEGGFEISHAGDYADFLQGGDIERETVRDLIPVYTFATLSVVSDEGQKFQSGFCTYFLVSDRKVSNRNWIEVARQHLVNADRTSEIHPCLMSFLRGIHFLESEKIPGNNRFGPVLNPYNWISPTSKEGAGEVIIFSSRRQGRILLSYPAILSHVSTALHRLF
ncbi:MAG: hypothetical protein N5P05_001506 [Chroococcopsis gigantea SAG 12.99]|jgi:hypothetical protein|nr:hypothetical protein [Chlorogloea purpurea SAG 13.99]MDV2999900.1 hypothetical protein [Chroococcopsis gigantea SAG 12.99]